MSTQRTALFELLLTILVTAFLVSVAQPLTGSFSALGLGHRYVDPVTPETAAKAVQAVALALELPQRIILLAAAGWLALRLGRTPLPRVSALALVTALWAVLWGTQFAPHGQLGWLLGAAGGCAVALFASLRWGPGPAAPQAVNAIAYPGWVLFTGLGLIWLVDYSARAYLKWQFLALYQFESLVLAYVVLTLVASGGGAGMGVLARLGAALDRATLPASSHEPGQHAWFGKLSPFFIPLGLAIWAALVVAFFGRQRPGLTSELLRLPFYAVGAWVVYRWAGQPAPSRFWAGGTLAILAVTLGLIGTGDFGQVLLIGLAIAIACGAAVTILLKGKRGAMPWGALIATCLMAGGLQLVERYGHWVSPHIGDRAFALANPFAGRFDYLSELRWFAASTPPGGHGLTQTPWCGTLAQIRETDLCRGVPKEMHSDYVFAGLAALWGPWMALAITLALGLWLLSMVRLSTAHLAGDPNRLRLAMFTFFVVATMVQLFFTALGSLGQVVLTGITFPFLAYGGASLVACAAMVGLGLPTSTNAAPNKWPAGNSF